MKTTKLKVRSIKLSDEDHSKAKRIGNGNFSAGIVKCLDNYSGAIPKTKRVEK